ncbi:MAG: DNA primase DnaG [Candidatus Saliniplasma sp.]
MDIDPSTTKYVIRTKLKANGVVEKPDVVGAIFGQTEGLLGDELDLRDLQKSGRMGRIEVKVSSSKGKSSGTVLIPSSLDLVETSIMAAALETIDRVGPCKAEIDVEEIEDVRKAKRTKIVERAKELLSEVMESDKVTSGNLTESVRQEVQMEEISGYGDSRSPAGPNVKGSDAIIIVEGRSDVLNLLKYGIKNAVAVEGTNIPDTIKELSKERVTTAFVDGDRGGSLILKELLETADVDYISVAPENSEVEELTQKQIMKALRAKIPKDQYVEMYDIDIPDQKQERRKKSKKKRQDKRKKNKQQKQQQKQKKPQSKFDEYREIIQGIKKEKKAVILDQNDETIDEVPIRKLAEELSSLDGKAKTVIFNGIVTQRLVDIAKEVDAELLLARKVGNIPKLPTSLEIISWDELTS